jgi:hypothetical protein
VASNAAFEIGPAAPELRRRCVCGIMVRILRGPPNTSLWRDLSAPPGELPLGSFASTLGGSKNALTHPRKRLPSSFSQDELMATQIVAWHALPPSSPRVARARARPYGLWGLTLSAAQAGGCHAINRGTCLRETPANQLPRSRKENVRCNRSSLLTNILPYKQGQTWRRHAK